MATVVIELHGVNRGPKRDLLFKRMNNTRATHIDGGRLGHQFSDGTNISVVATVLSGRDEIAAWKKVQSATFHGYEWLANQLIEQDYKLMQESKK